MKNKNPKILNIYYVETPLHLFISLLKNNNKLDSMLIIDLHREKQKMLYNSIGNLLSKYFETVITTHDFPQPVSIDSFKALHLSYIVSLHKEAKQIIKKIKNSYTHLNINVFTLNRMERVLINKLKKEMNFNLILSEEGIGSYTSPYHILGVDSLNKKNVIYEFLRKIAGFKLNPNDIKELQLLNPELISADYSNETYKIRRMEIDSKNISEFISSLKKDIFFSEKIEKVPKKIFFSNNINPELEYQFYTRFLEEFGIFYKNHPSLNENDIFDVNFLPWEIIQLSTDIEYIISYCSSSGLALLNISKSVHTKYIFLFELFHEIGINWLNFDSETILIYKYLEKFPINIFIPKTIKEMREIISL